VLVRIDSSDFDVALESARAALARAESALVHAAASLERQRSMRQTGASSRARLDDAIHAKATADAGVREAQVAVRRAELDLQRTDLRAPFTGRVREKRAGVGQSVVRGEPVANANEIVAALNRGALRGVLAEHRGVHYSFEGEQAEQRDFLLALVRAQLIALMVIYTLLAVPLRSYLQPLIIMSAIPFGLVGAAWGHLAMGYDFTMYSVLGLVALSGVVVNASPVLVDSVNRRVAEGAPLDRAVRDAGRARFRPILLTSLTTFAGLTPMMLETSVQARFMIPMAISIAFGVLFASFITLFLVPSAYLVLDDLQRLASSPISWMRLRSSSPSRR